MTWVPSLGWEDLPEEEMTTQSSILVWRIPWIEGLADCSHGVSKSRARLSIHSTARGKFLSNPSVQDSSFIFKMF